MKVSHFITSMHYQLICHIYFADRCWKCSLCLKLMVKICICYIHKTNTLLSACSFFKIANQILMRNYIKSCQATQVGLVSVQYSPNS